MARWRERCMRHCAVWEFHDALHQLAVKNRIVRATVTDSRCLGIFFGVWGIFRGDSIRCRLEDRLSKRRHDEREACNPARRVELPCFLDSEHCTWHSISRIPWWTMLRIYWCSLELLSLLEEAICSHKRESSLSDSHSMESFFHLEVTEIPSFIRHMEFSTA